MPISEPDSEICLIFVQSITMKWLGNNHNMTIKYKHYSIEPEGSNFNLFKEVDRKNEKTGVTTKVPVNIGWGMKFTTCIDHIIKDLLADRSETVSLTFFIDEYKRLKNEITEITEML